MMQLSEAISSDNARYIFGACSMRSYSREMGGASNFLYWFFSKSGFEDDIKKLAAVDDSIRLYLKDIYDVQI